MPGVENALETRTDAFGLAAWTYASVTRTNTRGKTLLKRSFQAPARKCSSRHAIVSLRNPKASQKLIMAKRNEGAMRMLLRQYRIYGDQAVQFDAKLCARIVGMGGGYGHIDHRPKARSSPEGRIHADMSGQHDARAKARPRSRTPATACRPRAPFRVSAIR